MTGLILERASASRLSGEWSDDDYDVLADGAVVGRIFKVRPHADTATSRRARPRWRLGPVPGVPPPTRAEGRAVRTARSWRGIFANAPSRGRGV